MRDGLRAKAEIGYLQERRKEEKKDSDDDGSCDNS